MDSNEIREAIKQFEELTGETSVGYIGNVWPAYYPKPDDRLWFIWFDRLPRGLGEPYPNNKPSLVLGSTEDVEALTRDQLMFKLGRRVGQLLRLQHEQSKEARMK